jgi:pimeloyl-ACP methyl ester carboxylesterase
MTDIVLVPGMWLGAWAWEAVTDRLRTAGHRVHPVTLTGVAERAGEPGAATADLDTHTDDLVRMITANDLRDVLLVGHSYGGLPVTAAADRLPERIARVVYVDSGPVPDGVAQFDLNEPDEQARLRTTLVGDGTLLPPPPWDPERDPVLQAGLAEPALTLLRERSTPHPFGSATQPLRRPADPPAVPTTLVACLFPLDQVRAMIDGGHPFFAGLAGADLRALPTGHWPMFSEPERLAALLAELAT